jgi:benzoate-CoA ligase
MMRMPELSSSDHSHSPPIINMPRHYNAAYDLIERNLRAGRTDKPAFIDDFGACTYGELEGRATLFANALRREGVEPEQRILLCLQDSIEFPVCFLGAILAGVVPVAVNTLLTGADYAFMVNDSHARIAVVSASLLPYFLPLLGRATA